MKLSAIPENVRFTKMHGNGNDFIIIDEFNGVIIPEEFKSDFVKAACNRRFGAGADGLIFVQKSDRADAKFRFFNSDGSEAEMCGNGIRCFSRFLVEENYAQKNLKAETLAGIKELNVSVDNGEFWVRVDMGKPEFESDKIPAKKKSGNIWKESFSINSENFNVYAVNTGVPHAVVLVEDLDFEIRDIARQIRYSKLFPRGTNVNFVKVNSTEEIEIRTYERGVEDETLSCGTGSVAAAAIANRLNLVSNKVRVITKGGMLKIELSDSAYMTGTANRVFDGFLRMNELRYDA